MSLVSLRSFISNLTGFFSTEGSFSQEQAENIIFDLIRSIGRLHEDASVSLALNERSLSIFPDKNYTISFFQTDKETRDSNLQSLKTIALRILEKTRFVFEEKGSLWKKILPNLPSYMEGIFPADHLNELTQEPSEWINSLIETENRADTMQKALCQMVLSLGESSEKLQIIQQIYDSFSSSYFSLVIIRALAQKLLTKIPFLEKIERENRLSFLEQLIPVIAYLIAHFARDDYILYDDSAYRKTEFHEGESIVYTFNWGKYRIYPICHPLTDREFRIVIVTNQLFAKGGFMEVFKAMTLADKEIVFKQTQKLPTQNLENLFNRVNRAFPICYNNLGMNPTYGLAAICEERGFSTVLIERKMTCDLADLIASDRFKTYKFKVREKIAVYLLEALSHLHKIGAHRDLKPKNILIGLRNNKIKEVCLTDFEMMLAPVIFAGTASYTAPDLLEYALMRGNVSKKFNAKEDAYFARQLDVWSAGLVILGLLDGKAEDNIMFKLNKLCENKIDRNKSFIQEDVDFQIDRLKELNLSDKIQEWCDLLKQMLKVSYLERPSVDQALTIARKIKNKSMRIA